jgi:hypothetical protein
MNGDTIHNLIPSPSFHISTHRSRRKPHISRGRANIFYVPPHSFGCMYGLLRDSWQALKLAPKNSICLCYFIMLLFFYVHVLTPQAPWCPFASDKDGSLRFSPHPTPGKAHLKALDSRLIVNARTPFGSSCFQWQAKLHEHGVYGFFAARRDRLFLAPPRRHFTHRKNVQCPSLTSPSHPSAWFFSFFFEKKKNILREKMWKREPSQRKHEKG